MNGDAPQHALLFAAVSFYTRANDVLFLIPTDCAKKKQCLANLLVLLSISV